MQMILPIVLLLLLFITVLACLLMAAFYMIVAVATGIIHLVRFIKNK